MTSEQVRRRDGGLRIGVEMISAGAGFGPGAGGMITYYDGLLRGLCARSEVESVVVFVAPWNKDLGVPKDPKIEVVECRGLRQSRAFRVVYEQTVLAALATFNRVDVLLCTVNIMPLLRRAPTVIVLQSIQYFMWPEHVGRFRRAYLHFFTPKSLKKADRVITVTDTERSDAIELFDVDPERMITVYHGVPAWTRASLNGSKVEPYRLADHSPYVLIVSRLYSHKNHHRLIEGFAMFLKEHGAPHHLVIAGADGDITSADLESHAASLGISDRVHLLGRAPQEQVTGLYAGAAAFVYPSMYETFGLPVLEAFVLGLPLITSEIGATKEVAGDAARLVDPADPQSIADGLAAVLNDEDYRESMIAAGRARGAEFTWERCAGETLAVLEQAVAAR